MTNPLSPKLCRSVGEASDLLKLIGNPNRLSIVCFLLEEESSVATLEEQLGIRQPTLSQQLSELRDAGIIEGRRDGKSIIYRVLDPRASQLVVALRGIFQGLKDVTGRETGDPDASTLEDTMFD